MIRHLQKCHRNPQNSPRISLDWEYIEDFEPIKEFLIKNPCTDKMKEFNAILAPRGDPYDSFLDEMVNYAKELPKLHKDAMVNAKLDEIFTKGINVRLLDKDEYIEKLKAKVRGGQRLFLFNPLIPTTGEEIEQNKDMLWQ